MGLPSPIPEGSGSLGSQAEGSHESREPGSGGREPPSHTPRPQAQPYTVRPHHSLLLRYLQQRSVKIAQAHYFSTYPVGALCLGHVFVSD